MNHTLTVLISLILLISVSGCSFILKDYDDTNEKRLAELTKESQQTDSEIASLKRKLPGMDRQIKGISDETEELGDKVATLESKHSGDEGDVPLAVPETVTQVVSTETKAKPKVAPATPEPAKKVKAKPEVITPQQAKSQKKLTAAGARLMEIAVDKGLIEPKPEEPAAAPAPAPQKVASAKPVEKATPPKIPAPEIKPTKKVTPQSVRLKVLSGTGKLFSAQKMTKTLYDMGYRSERMDMAPRSNFTRNTVYYAKGYKDTAESIKKNLGGNSITKPLTWYSIFDIIVVAGP